MLKGTKKKVKDQVTEREKAPPGDPWQDLARGLCD